ncbi:MAG: hypothetical protein N2746_07550 [Deltaproteobacteria bacterium]|nr:hypothetical protein [Deltaproteobacteria bacterium]
MKKLFLSLLIVTFFSTNLFADDRAINPQFKQEDKKDKAKENYETKIIEQKRMKDSERVGSYNQPVWTTKRRFPTTRVYVIPENKVELEYWLLMEGNLEDNTDPKYTGIYEIEFGLGHRLQSDFYLKTLQKDSNSPIEIISQSIELRYAFFDWGKVFGNPTIYLEWIRQSAKPQKGEIKLLLGDEISERLIWGANLIFERVLGGESEQEYAFAGGIAYSLIDGYLSLGLETKVVFEDDKSKRFDFFEKKFLLGPSILYKPVPAVSLIATPLFGLKMEEEEDEEETEGIYSIYLIIGVDL